MPGRKKEKENRMFVNALQENDAVWIVINQIFIYNTAIKCYISTPTVKSFTR